MYQFHTHPKPTKGKEKVFIPKKIVCYRCGGVHLAPDCKFKNAECHMCKKVGHIARACRRKPTQTGFQDKRLKDHHYLEDEVQDTAASQKQSKEHPYPLFNMDSNEHKAFMVDVNINQVPVSMEYDTGAALTLITKRTYERIRQRNHMEPLQDSEVQ